MLTMEQTDNGHTIFIDGDGFEIGEMSSDGESFYPGGAYDEISRDELEFILCEMNKSSGQQN